MEEFLSDLDKQILVIRQAFSAGDAEFIRKEAHTIKGGAANIFATGLSDAAEKIENSTQSGNFADTASAIEELVRQKKLLYDYIVSHKKR